MRYSPSLLLALMVLPLQGNAAEPSAPEAACATLFNVERTRLHSREKVDLCALTSGKPVLLVNTASHCGFTSQFRGLESLHQRFADQGLVVVGYPSNDFNQEAGDEAKTAEVCYVNYGVTFTMLAPGSVTGSGADSIFKAVAAQSVQPSWNFNKYLIDEEGVVLAHFPSHVRPDDENLMMQIEAQLSAEPG